MIATPADIAAAVERIKTLTAIQTQSGDRYELRRILIEEHHEPHAVDLALAQVYGFRVEGSTLKPTPNGTSVVVSSTVAASMVFANTILISALIAATYNVMSRSVSYNPIILAIIIPIVAVLGIEALAIPRLRDYSPARARGVTWGVVMTLACIIILAAFITLVALIG